MRYAAMDDLTDLMRYQGVLRNDSQLFTALSQRIDLHTFEQVYFGIIVAFAPISLILSGLIILTMYVKQDNEKLTNLLTYSPLAADMIDSLFCLCKMPHAYAGNPHSESECVFITMFTSLAAYVDAILFLFASLEWLLIRKNNSWQHCAASRRKAVGRVALVLMWLCAGILCVSLNLAGRRSYITQTDSLVFCAPEGTVTVRLQYTVVLPALMLLSATVVPLVYVRTRPKSKATESHVTCLELRDSRGHNVDYLEEQDAVAYSENSARLALFLMTCKFLVAYSGPIAMRAVYENLYSSETFDYLVFFFHAWYSITALWLLLIPANCVILLAVRRDLRVSLYDLLCRRCAKCLVHTGQSLKARYQQLR